MSNQVVAAWQFWHSNFGTACSSLGAYTYITGDAAPPPPPPPSGCYCSTSLGPVAISCWQERLYVRCIHVIRKHCSKGLQPVSQ